MGAVNLTLERQRWNKALSKFSVNGKCIPLYMHDGIINYIVDHIPPGGFLYSVISNDLYGACSKADDINRDILFIYMSFFYNECPSGCWGSPEKVRHWLDQGRPV